MASQLDGPALWLVIAAAGLGTYAIRVSFVALFGRFDDVPDGVERALRFVPAAVLAALVAPDVVAPEGTLALSASNPRPLAAAVAAAVAWYTEDVAATLLSGMGALWLASYVLA